MVHAITALKYLGIISCGSHEGLSLDYRFFFFAIDGFRKISSFFSGAPLTFFSRNTSGDRICSRKLSDTACRVWTVYNTCSEPWGMARLNRALAKSHINKSAHGHMVATAMALAGRHLRGAGWTGVCTLFFMSFVARLRKLVLYSTPTDRRAVHFLFREVGEYDFRELFRFHKADFTG